MSVMAEHQSELPEATVEESGPGLPKGNSTIIVPPNYQMIQQQGTASSIKYRERIILPYNAGRDNEPPHLYWTFVETTMGTIYATGDTQELLESDIIDCAVMLGYTRSSIVLVTLE